MLFSMNPSVSIEGDFINLLAPNETSVRHAMKKARITRSIYQVINVSFKDHLPKYWPDRFDVTYLNAEKQEVQVTFVRLRTITD